MKLKIEKNIMRSFLLNLFFLLISWPLFGQADLGLHFMRNVWNSSHTNPAIVQQQKFIVILPSLYNNFQFTGATYADLLSTNEAGETVISANAFINKLEDENYIQEHFDAEAFGLAFTLGNFSFSVSHALRFNAYLSFPKALPQLIWQGNAQFIGQTVDIGHDLHLFGYNEFALGTAYKISDGISIGGRLKLLNGIGDISTDRNELSLSTDEESYQLSMQADYRVNTSSFLSYGGFDDIELKTGFGEFDFDEFFTSNTGVAFDLGAFVTLGKWDFALSVVDIGNIHWESDVSNYTSKGTFEYQGLDIAKALIEDSIELNFALDTLEQLFEVVETSNDYTTRLPMKTYLSTNWQMNDTWRFGGLIYVENYREKIFPSAALSAQAQLTDWLSVGGIYSISNKAYNHLGLNTQIRLGPIQLYGITDNILTLFTPEKSNGAHFRVGMNLLFL